MLQRMGWKQGTGLGRREDGITEPVNSHFSFFLADLKRLVLKKLQTILRIIYFYGFIQGYISGISYS